MRVSDLEEFGRRETEGWIVARGAAVPSTRLWADGEVLEGDALGGLMAAGTRDDRRACPRCCRSRSGAIPRADEDARRQARALARAAAEATRETDAASDGGARATVSNRRRP